MLRRTAIAVLALSLTVAACGDDAVSPSIPDDLPGVPTGGVDLPTGGGDAPPGGGDTPAGGADTPTAGDDTTFYGNPVGTGTVEIGDRHFEFDLDTLCLTMFGNIGVYGTASDGSDVTVDATFPPESWETDDEDWDPPAINVSDDVNDESWEADVGSVMEWPEGTSQVDSFTNDGRRAWGEATFIETYASLSGDPVVEKGRFEFHCPEG